jgi:sec-independent protein translocase protein TatC
MNKPGMKKISSFFRGVWRVISLPFRVIAWLRRRVKEGFQKARAFMSEEPEERPLSETLVNTFQQPTSVFEHIEALRKHLLRMVLALILCVTVVAVFATKLIDLIAKPIGGIEKLQAIEVTETVGTYMLVSLVGGFALAIPYIAFELWLFAAPGLRARSRWMGLIGIPLALVFFLGGVAFAYFMLLPTALPFLLNFMGVSTVPRISSYINFVTGLLFWLGIAFEFPLVIYVVTLMGLIKPRQLAKQWRYAVVLIAIMAAAITPTVDPVNMALVMLPMVLLYFISIGLSFLASAGRRGAEKAAS